MNKVKCPGAPRRRQQGGIAIFAAIGIGVLVSMLALLDIGFMYHYKREYQKAADLAAVAGASRLFNGCSSAETVARSHANQQIGAIPHNSVSSECGLWIKSGDERGFSPLEGASIDANAVRVTVNGRPPRFLMPGGRNVVASAVAVSHDPVAALTIRAAAASVSVSQSELLDALLNDVVGLDADVELGVAGWSALLDADISLLQYMDAVAVNLGVSAGSYGSLLHKSLTVRDVVAGAISVLEDGGSLALSYLEDIYDYFPENLPMINMADLIRISSIHDSALLNSSINLLELVKVAIGNSNRGKIVDLSIPQAAGLINSRLVVKQNAFRPVVSIGNPVHDEIKVQTHNVRALIRLELGVNGTLNHLLNSVLSVVDTVPVLNQISQFLNSTDLIAGLVNLVGGVLSCVVGECHTTPIYVDTVNGHLDVAVDFGDGEAVLTNHRCGDGDKYISVDAMSSVGRISFGHFDESDIFELSELPKAQPAPIIEIGYRRARSCLLCPTEWEQSDGGWRSGESGRLNAKRYVIAGIGIHADRVPLVQSKVVPVMFVDAPPEDRLPNIGQMPEFKPIDANDNVIYGLGSALQGVNVKVYRVNGNMLGRVLEGSSGLLNQLIGVVQDTVENVLHPVLGPTVDEVLDVLGAKLGQSEIGANMTCGVGGGVIVN